MTNALTLEIGRLNEVMSKYLSVSNLNQTAAEPLGDLVFFLQQAVTELRESKQATLSTHLKTLNDHILYQLQYSTSGQSIDGKLVRLKEENIRLKQELGRMTQALENVQTEQHDSKMDEEGKSQPLVSSVIEHNGKSYEQLSQEVHILKMREKETLEALDCYRRAFDKQLQKSKTLSNVLVNKVGISKQSSVQNQVGTLTELVNTLSETVRDKDIVIAHLRESNRMSNERIQTLEKTLQQKTMLYCDYENHKIDDL